MSHEQFWIQEGLSHMIPSGFGEFPEGFDVREVLKSLAEDLNYKSIIDFGCGYGRLCQSFAKEKYLGIDVNKEALEMAEKKYEGYRFELSHPKPRYADIYLAHTVFLHLQDKEIHEALRQMRCKYLIISEILGKEWRREGLPPAYNRNLSDYVTLLRSHDLILHREEKKPYKRYADTSFYNHKNTDISFLVFKKLSCNPKMS